MSIDEILDNIRIGTGLGGWKKDAKSQIEALILEARIKELEALPKPDGTLTTTAYAIKVDYAIQDRLTQLKEQTNE